VAGGLVVPGGVEGQFSEEFAGGGVQDPDAEVLDEQQDVGSGVGAADDVVEPPVRRLMLPVLLILSWRTQQRKYFHGGG
jgi:hypothetical protein